MAESFDAQKLLTYNALDSACTLEAQREIWPDLADGYEETYWQTIRLMGPLEFMMLRGIKVDVERLVKTKEDVTHAILEKQEELDSLVGHHLNINSSKQCQQYFYIELGIPPYHNRSTGAISCDDLAMQRLARGTAQRPGLRQAKLVQEIRGLSKLLSTYLEIQLDEDNRLRCVYDPRGTKTGRQSSKKSIDGTGMNLQNLPPEFKGFLVADEGFFLFEADKRQAEWVVVAYLANDYNMIKAVEEGLDVHVHTASLMYDVTPDIVDADHELIGSTTQPDLIEDLRAKEFGGLLHHTEIESWPRTMSLRQAGKKANHGLNYDEGPDTFSLMNEIERQEGIRIISMYHNIYPGIRQTFHSQVREQLRKDRTLVNCFGRKRVFLNSWGDKLFKEAYAQIPQSTVVDGLNIGLVKAYEDNSEEFYPLEQLAQVHDSCLCQLPIRNIQTFPILLSQLYDYVSPTMRYSGREFTIKTDVKVGYNWGKYHKDKNPTGMKESPYEPDDNLFHSFVTGHLGF